MSFDANSVGTPQHVLEFEKNSLAYVDAEITETPEEVWTKVKVLAQQGPVVSVRTANGNVMNVDLSETELVPANKGSVSDLTSLYFMNEAAILQNLQERSYADDPYTFMANVLVSVNPLMSVKDYSQHLGNSSALKIVHPYSVAEQAYQELCFRFKQRGFDADEKVSQSVVMSGESGAGKTEAAKRVLKHILLRASNSESNSLAEKLLESNEILEAFGNAGTLRNHNSSRFGKFIQLWFKQANNSIFVEKATIKTYLLEKSRITRVGLGEHNYHVFYYLYLTENDDMCLEPDSFLKQEYIKSSERGFTYLDPVLEDEEEHAPKDDFDDDDHITFSVARQKDERNYKRLLEAFKVFNLSSDYINSLYLAIAGILHLGNIQFEDHFLRNETVAEENLERFKNGFSALKKASQLFGIASEDLYNLLTSRKIKVGQEVSIKKLNAQSATVARDSIARSLYSSIFQRVQKLVTDHLLLAKEEGEEVGFIGILDIFGFEVFEKNSFEQLLINYANEALQETFNKSIFFAELELYKKEGLFDLNDHENEMDIHPPDNSACLKVFQGLRKNGIQTKTTIIKKLKAQERMQKMGLLRLLDAETWELKSSDLKLNATLHRAFDKNECFGRLHPLDRKDKFVIKHFAGLVTYNVNSFIAKNKDSVPAELIDTFASTENEALKSVFDMLEAKKQLRKAQPTRMGRRKSKKKKTVANEFNAQMKNLIATLESTRVSFIRCIKPNATLFRGDIDTWFNRRYVSHQLRNLAIPQTVRVLSNGFPTRLNYSQLVEDFKKFLPVEEISKYNLGQSSEQAEKSFIEALFFAFEIERDSYKLGYTKVFFKSGEISKLEKVLRAASEWDETGDTAARDIVVEKFKGFYVRKRLRVLLRKAFVIGVFTSTLNKLREKRRLAIRKKWRITIIKVVTQVVLLKLHVKVVEEIRRKEEEERKRKEEEERRKEEERKRQEEEKQRLAELARIEEEKKKAQEEKQRQELEEKQRLLEEEQRVQKEIEEKERLRFEAEENERKQKEAEQEEQKALLKVQKKLSNLEKSFEIKPHKKPDFDEETAKRLVEENEEEKKKDEAFVKAKNEEQARIRKAKRNLSIKKSRFHDLRNVEDKKKYLDPFNRMENLVEFTEDEILSEQQIQECAVAAVDKLKAERENEAKKLYKQMLAFAKDKPDFRKRIESKIAAAKKKDEEGYKRLVKVEVEKLRLRNTVNIMKAEEKLEQDSDEEEQEPKLLFNQKMKSIKKSSAQSSRFSQALTHFTVESHFDSTAWEYQGIQNGKRVYLNPKTGLMKYKKVEEEQDDGQLTMKTNKTRLRSQINEMNINKVNARERRRRTVARTAHNVAIDLVADAEKKLTKPLSPRKKEEQVTAERDKILKEFAEQNIDSDSDDGDVEEFGFGTEKQSNWMQTSNSLKFKFANMYEQARRRDWFTAAEDKAKNAIKEAQKEAVRPESKRVRRSKRGSVSADGQTKQRSRFTKRFTRDKGNTESKRGKGIFGFTLRRGKKKRKGSVEVSTEAPRQTIEEMNVIQPPPGSPPAQRTGRGGSANIQRRRKQARRPSVLRNGQIVQRMVEKANPLDAAMKQLDNIDQLGASGDLAPEEVLQLKNDLAEKAKNQAKKQRRLALNKMVPGLENIVMSSRRRKPADKKTAELTRTKRTKRDEQQEFTYYDRFAWDLQAPLHGGKLRMVLIPEETKNIYDDDLAESMTFFTTLVVFERTSENHADYEEFVKERKATKKKSVASVKGMDDEQEVGTRKFVEWRVLHVFSDFIEFNKEMKSGKYKRFLSTRQRAEITPLVGAKKNLMQEKNFQFFANALQNWFKNLQKALSSDKISKEFFQEAGKFWELQGHLDLEDLGVNYFDDVEEDDSSSDESWYSWA